MLIDAIATANRDQSDALEEEAIAVRQMDELTQHNAALVEETDAAIEQTEVHPSELDRIVAVFRSGQLAAVPRLARPAAPRPAQGGGRRLGEAQRKVLHTSRDNPSFTTNG